MAAAYRLDCGIALPRQGARGLPRSCGLDRLSGRVRFAEPALRTYRRPGSARPTRRNCAVTCGVFPCARESLPTCYRSNPSMTHTSAEGETLESATRRSRITRVTVVVCLDPTLGVSVCVTRQLTRAVVPSIDNTRTASIATFSSRMSLNALARLSVGIDGCTFFTALASRLSSAAEYRCSVSRTPDSARAAGACGRPAARRAGNSDLQTVRSDWPGLLERDALSGRARAATSLNQLSTICSSPAAGPCSLLDITNHEPSRDTS